MPDLPIPFSISLISSLHALISSNNHSTLNLWHWFLNSTNTWDKISWIWTLKEEVYFSSRFQSMAAWLEGETSCHKRGEMLLMWRLSGNKRTEAEARYQARFHSNSPWPAIQRQDCGEFISQVLLNPIQLTGLNISSVKLFSVLYEGSIEMCICCLQNTFYEKHVYMSSKLENSLHVIYT